MEKESLVPILIHKKRKNLENKILRGIVLKKKIRQNNTLSKKLRLSKAENFVKENIKKKTSILVSNRLVKNVGKFVIPAKAKTLFVIRIRGINGVSPQIKKILQLLRLNQINNGVFLKINSSTTQMLKKIEHFIAYGYPKQNTIKNLIEKRGYGKIGKRGSWQRVFLSDNKIIEEGLGEFGISNFEEIINELYTCGPRFKEINNFLFPFQLKSPKKGYSYASKNKHFVEGGAYGNWEETINQLIRRMN